MITPSYSATATERVLPRLALDFTTASLDARVTVTRSLNTATRTNASGILEIVNANLPRFDYDPSTLACKGLLIEEARTNLLLNSLIDGTNLSTQSVTLSAVAYTLSFYGAGSVAISGGHSATVAGTGNYPNRRTYTFTPSAGSTTFTVSGDVKYAQLEAGAFATSYIPTTTTSLTRNADVVSMTGTNFSSWFNASEGAFAAWFSSFSSAPGILGDQTAASAVLYSSSLDAKTFNGASGLTANGTFTLNAPAKCVLAYSGAGRSIALNGNTVAQDANALQSVTTLEIGRSFISVYLNGHFSKLFYYPQRITNAEVQAFSKG